MVTPPADRSRSWTLTRGAESWLPLIATTVAPVAAQTGDGVVEETHGLERWDGTVEQIAGDDHRVDLRGDGEVDDGVDHGCLLAL
ncbi:MAG: hypothetical protein V9G12_19645 [Microthrixaceae bacterium]